MSTRTLKGLRTALVAVAALGSWMSANAQNTLAGTPINNRATVNYSVGGFAQAPIESSPTGNVTPGVGLGANTTFLVDNRINLSVSEISGSATTVTPGMANQVLAFTVANSGNAPEGYQLTLTEEVGTVLFGNTDNAQFLLANLAIRVDDGDNTFDAGDTATAIDSLAPSTSVMVFVLANPIVPLAQINGNFANVNLQARAAVPGTNGGTLETASPAGNLPNVVEIMFVDAGNDATASATDQFAVVSAGLRITKVETILDDPFASAIPRALPGSNVEYLITIQNTSTTTPATGVSLSDPIPANTSLRANQYSPTADVAITGGLAATCNADALDADADGCGINGLGALTVSAAVIGNVAASSSVTLRFQVTIL